MCKIGKPKSTYYIFNLSKVYNQYIIKLYIKDTPFSDKTLSFITNFLTIVTFLTNFEFSH